MRATGRSAPHLLCCAAAYLFGGGLVAHAAAPPSDGFTDLLTPPEVHGFVSQGAIKSTHNNYLVQSKRGSLEFTEVGINFTKALGDNLRAGMQLFSRDLGRIGNYTPRFDWFYLDYRVADWFGFRVGRTKLPFGLYNEFNDIDSARVSVLLPQSMYPTENRDYLLAQTGAELYGDVPMGRAGTLEYRAYGGTVFFDADESATIGEVEVPYIAGGRLMWRLPVEGLQFGGSVQALRFDGTYVPPAADVEQAQMDGTLSPGFDGQVDFQLPGVLWIASIEYAAYDWVAAAEYSHWYLGLESSEPVLLPTVQVANERGYALLTYRGLRWLSPGVYYSVLFPNMAQRSGKAASQHDVALTLRTDITEHWLVKLEGHYLHGTAALNPALNDNVPQADLVGDWGLFLLKTTAYF